MMATERRKHTKRTLNKDMFDELIADDVKKDVDIVRLFNEFGVKLSKRGNSFVGLCPFHDDKNPSLSVDRNKGLFNCFGCGESGDVITLVQKIKGLDFKGSLDFLKRWKNGVIPDLSFPEAEDPAEDLRLDIKELEGSQPLTKSDNGLGKPEEDTTQTVNETEQISLNDIAEHYHRELFNHQEAIEYLHKRRIKNPEIISRFKIGFSNGKSLLNKLSKKQMDSLIQAGILRKNRQEAFTSCLVFPIFNDNGQIVHFYARNINDKAKIKHLYLSGSHKSVFNLKAVKVYSDQMILTECIIDALSLIQLGIDNVLPCYGAQTLTDEMLDILKEHRVKEIVIAFDNDDAGINGAEKLKEKLLDNGFAVRIIFPSQTVESDEKSVSNQCYKDWNEELENGITAEEIKKLIEDAELLKPTEVKESFKVTKDNFKYIFTIADVDYTVTGVKDIFVSNLRINVKAEYQGEWFPDNLDLYSARSRASFGSNISQKFGVEATRIEKDLLKILEHLEKERDKALTGKEEAEVELTEEEREIGLTFLKSPNLFDQVVRDMETLGYVGEDLNKQLLYICASTRKLEDPISVLIISQSASGKSYLVDTVKMLLPENDVIAITSLSDQALNYIPDGGLVHKFLTLGESVHSEVIEHQIREMLSGKELTRLVTTKDEKTGQLISKQVKTKVVVASVMSTTNHRINPENASRYFLINADESKEQTRKIHEAQRNKYSLERYYEKKEKIPEVIKKHKSAQRLLRNIIIVNPFARHLDFPDATMRTRRDNERFLDLIAGVCFLRQYQKEIKKDGNLEYIECDLVDYEIAYNIMVNGVLSSTLVELPGGTVLLYEEVRKMVKVMANEKNLQPEEVSFIQREIREQTKLGGEFIKKHLRLLVEYEYLNFTSGKNKGTRYSYQLRKDEEIKKIDLNVIPTPEDMRVKLKKL